MAHSLRQRQANHAKLMGYLDEKSEDAMKRKKLTDKQAAYEEALRVCVPCFAFIRLSHQLTLHFIMSCSSRAMHQLSSEQHLRPATVATSISCVSLCKMGSASSLVPCPQKLAANLTFCTCHTSCTCSACHVRQSALVSKEGHVWKLGVTTQRSAFMARAAERIHGGTCRALLW